MLPSRAMRNRTVTQLLGSGIAALVLVAAAPLAAQDGAATGTGTADEPQGESPSDLPAPSDAVVIASQDDTLPPAPEFNAAGERQIAFEADILSYDSEAGVTTAQGNVLLRSGDRSLRADTVTWSQRSGQIVASGNVRFVDETGNQIFTDNRSWQRVTKLSG